MPAHLWGVLDGEPAAGATESLRVVGTAAERGRFNLLGVPAIYQSMAQGAIILLAVALDTVTRTRAREA